MTVVGLEALEDNPDSNDRSCLGTREGSAGRKADTQVERLTRQRHARLRNGGEAAVE